MGITKTIMGDPEYGIDKHDTDQVCENCGAFKSSILDDGLPSSDFDCPRCGHRGEMTRFDWDEEQNK